MVAYKSIIACSWYGAYGTVRYSRVCTVCVDRTVCTEYKIFRDRTVEYVQMVRYVRTSVRVHIGA